MEKFEIANAFTAKWERGLVDHPNDPGGITNNGASLKWLQDIDADIDGDGDVDADDVRALTQRQIDQLFKTNFWDRCNCGEFSTPVATVLYDSVVNTGQGQGIKFLQRACGVNADGKLGPVTRTAAVIHHDQVALALKMCDYRQEFYNNLAKNKPKFQAFIKGWTNRVNDLKQYVRMSCSDY